MINDGEKIQSTNNGFLMKLEFGLRIEEISTKVWTVIGYKARP
jgi:hypothetical protein